MEALNLPTYNLKIVSENNQTKIFDIIRKKYVVLTPEEWVRQNFIHYLINEKQYPSSLIAVEISLKYNTLQKRADIVIYNKKGEPVVLVECKATNVKITQETFHQAAVYNMNFKVNHLIVTNGLNHYCCQMNYADKTYLFLSQIPDFQ